MQLPSPDPDTLFEDLLQDLPPETVEMAREFKAFSRARKIKTPQQLLRVVLLYCGLDQSLREVAGTMTLLVQQISDSSITERLTACRPWVKALLPKMLGQRELASLPNNRRFIVIDGSTVQSPGAKRIHYRLHIAMDLLTLAFTEVMISTAKTGESLRHFSLGAGDVAIADRGYCHPQAVVDTLAAQADMVLRLNPHNMPLYHDDGAPVDLVAALQDQAPTSVHTLSAWVGPESQRVKGWVHAYRLTEEQANKARAQCRNRNSKKGKTPKERTLFLAGYVLVWTSLPPEVMSADTIMRLYRLRWQVELAIKRWKSLLDVDALRARTGSPLAELWLHGKLLYALLVERRMRRLLGDHWGRLDRERTATWWRPWKLLHASLVPRLTGSLSWPEQHWQQSLAVLAERPRQRTLQRLPEQLCLCQVGVDTLLTPVRDEVWEELMAA